MIYSVLMISAALLCAGLLLVIYSGLVRRTLPIGAVYEGLVFIALGFFPLVGSLILLRGRRLTAAGWIIALAVAASAIYLVYRAGDVARPILFANLVALVVAALLLRRRGAEFLIAGILSMATVIIFFLESRFPGPVLPAAGRLNYVVVDIFVLVITALLLYFWKGSLYGVLRGTLANEKDLQAKNQILESLRQELESRVAEQTAELGEASAHLAVRANQFEAIGEVARSIASIQDLALLLPQIAHAVSDRFGFYHTGIFLLDERGEFAVLRAASSEGGARMLRRNHRLRIGAQGIVGYVAQAGAPRIAADVGKDAVFFNNPDLPETHSEMGLPLTVGNRIIGVLDVQSSEVAAFSAEDVEILTALASQVAIAIENSRLFTRTREALAELERVTHQSTRAAWERISVQDGMVGYRYDGLSLESLAAPAESIPFGQAAITGESASAAETLAVPIKVRGQTIGVLGLKSRTQERTWHPDEVTMAEAAADRVGLALENARLLDETSARAERERTVAEITNKVRATNDPQVMIETAMRELKEVLGASRVHLSLSGPSDHAEQAGD